MTFKTIIYAGLLATASVVASQTGAQAASLEQAAQLKSAVRFSDALSPRENFILVHDPSYKQYRAAHRRAHARPRHYGYGRYDRRRARAKDRHYRRTCVVMHNYPDLGESALTMPPWKWVPC